MRSVECCKSIQRIDQHNAHTPHTTHHTVHSVMYGILETWNHSPLPTPLYEGVRTSLSHVSPPLSLEGNIHRCSFASYDYDRCIQSSIRSWFNLTYLKFQLIGIKSSHRHWYQGWNAESKLNYHCKIVISKYSTWETLNQQTVRKSMRCWRRKSSSWFRTKET